MSDKLTEYKPLAKIEELAEKKAVIEQRDKSVPENGTEKKSERET